MDSCKKEKISGSTTCVKVEDDWSEEDIPLRFLVPNGLREKILDFDYTCCDDCSSIIKPPYLERKFNPECQNIPRYITRSLWRDHEKRKKNFFNVPKHDW